MTDDWRLTGQEAALQGAAFVHKPYRAWSEEWDHDHCEFCTRKLVASEDPTSEEEGAVTGGYAALGRGPQREDDYYWVCDDCFADFRERFGWTVASPPD